MKDKNILNPTRTTRQLLLMQNTPRFIASGAVIIWLCILYLGTSALKRIEDRYTLGDHNLLLAGDRHWAVVPVILEKKCLGYLETRLHELPTPSLALNGSLNVLLDGNPIQVNLSVLGNFSSYNKLQDFSLDFSVKTSSIHLLPSVNSPNMISVRLTLPEKSREILVPRPEPIFLVKHSHDEYFLHFPKSTWEFLANQTLTSNPLDQVTGITFREISSSEVAACKKDLTDWNRNLAQASQVIDVGQYLRLFRVIGKQYLQALGV